jgi:N-acetylglutamate synthase-like GNAT family acetyltransferase
VIYNRLRFKSIQTHGLLLYSEWSGIIKFMRVRKAEKADFPDIIRLAKSYNLDYAGMEADDFWVAEEGGQVRGICGLKKQSECWELCALGVEEAWRGRGWGGRLVRAVLRGIPAELYLATVIPSFFAHFGFEKADVVPDSMVKKAEWCAGCTPELCTVMIRQGGT